MQQRDTKSAPIVEVGPDVGKLAPCAILMHGRTHGALRTAVVGAFVSFASTASASGALEVIGAPTSANGLNARLFAEESEAAYFNPALLPYAKPTTEAGLFFLFVHGNIQLHQRPASVDVLDSVYNGQVRNPDGSTSRLDIRPLPTSALPNPRTDTNTRETITYVTLGVVRPLYEDKLVLGFYALLPVRSFQEQKAFFPDEREQYFSNQLSFELLGDRLSLTSFAVALGSRIASWMSLGVGVDVTIGTVAKTHVHVPDAGDQRVVLINPDIEVESAFAPYFAATMHPATWLRLVTTLHLPSSSTTDGENRIRFWNYTYPEGENSINQTYALSLGYEPLRFGIGGAILGPSKRPTKQEPSGFAKASRAHETAIHEWEVGARAMITQWSEYVDRHATRPLDRWSNMISAGLGGSAMIGDRRLAADLTLTPSPVPAQTGRTNYVDNTRIGANLSFETPLSVLGANLDAGLFLHGQLLLAREVSKSMSVPHPVVDEVADNAVDIVSGEPLEGAGGLQTNNPGYPGFKSDGWLLGAGLVVRLPQ